MDMRPFPKLTFVSDRESYLANLCRCKVVLHLGCADALMLEGKAAIGRHLHLLVRSVAQVAYGVDSDKVALTTLQTKYGVQNLFVGDVEKLDVPIPTKVDIILATELVEHLPNPGMFLDSVRRYMSPESTLVVTTPNLLSVKVFIHSLFGKQRIHWDHTVGFTFSLLETLLARHGYAIQGWMTTVERFSGTRNQLSNFLLLPLFKLFPRYGDTIIVIARQQK